MIKRGELLKKFIFSILIIIFLISAYIFYNMDKSNTETIFFSDDIYLIVEDQLIEFGEPVIEKNGIIYFSFDILSKYVDEDLFFDEDESMLILTSENYVKRFIVDENIASINSKEYSIDNPVINIDGLIYVPLDIFTSDYNIVINHYKETNAVVLDYTDMEYLEGEIILDYPIIRSDLSDKSPMISNNLIKGSTVNVYGEYEEWFKIRTQDGIPGFIEKQYVKLLLVKDKYKNELMEKNVDNQKSDKKINLTWDYTYSKVKYTDKIAPIHGVNVIAPTWFSILDTEGNILDKGNKEYVAKYKALGYDIWALVDNSFDPDLTHDFLSSSKTREDIILKLLEIYLDYGFNGINIDFENIHLKDRDLLTQFVRELYPVFKDKDIIVSMDITTISTSENWSMCYDRKRLQNTVDYLILMAYDQHWASSPIAGSVAEYSWVENGILKVLDEIANEKLILAIPFYTRLWKVEDTQISSKSLSMIGANDFISDNQIQTVWNEEIRQYYGEIEKEDALYMIWIEDEISLNHKISLVHKYDLIGIASWRKGYETPNIWDAINKSLN